MVRADDYGQVERRAGGAPAKKIVRQIVCLAERGQQRPLFKIPLSERRELAAPAHHEHTLAVFFYLSAANHPGVRLLLKSPIWDASTPYALYAFYHPCKR